MDAQSSQNARQVAGCKVLGASKAASALVTCVRCHQTGPFNVTNAFPSCCLARLLLLQLASWPWQSRVIQKLLWSLVLGRLQKTQEAWEVCEEVCCSEACACAKKLAEAAWKPALKHALARE